MCELQALTDVAPWPLPYMFCFWFFLLTLQEKNAEIWPSVWDFQMASGPARVETVSLLDHTTDCPEIQDEWPQAKSTVINLWRFTLYESNAFRTYQLPMCLMCSLEVNQAASHMSFYLGSDPPSSTHKRSLIYVNMTDWTYGVAISLMWPEPLRHTALYTDQLFGKVCKSSLKFESSQMVIWGDPGP